MPSNKVNNFFGIPLLCQICDFSKHDHQVLVLFLISNSICTLVWKWFIIASHTSFSIKRQSVNIWPYFLQKRQWLGVKLGSWFVPWINPLHTHSPSRNMFFRLYLTLVSLFCNTLVLDTTTIIALFTIIGRVVCSTLVSIIDWYIVLNAKACSSKYFS